MEALRLAVLGDSIAFGQGAASAAERPGALLAQHLTHAGFGVEVRVFAVPGARSDGLSAQTERALPWRPDVVVVVVGANDLTHFVPPPVAAAHLERSVRALRAIDTEVVVAPAPDLSALPHVPEAAQLLVRRASAALRAEQVRAARAAGARIADADATTSRAFADDPSLFSPDRFHPSGAGYRVIASALAPEVVAAAEVRRPETA